ncbi:hypothetical protein FRC04_001360 [Tulasnella sp. 424]|nr:hypothetical protein FRC04_001360 [Tulasnella sp. 424]
MSYSLRSKPSWWTKYKDETIRSKWKAEALAAPVEGDKLTEGEVDYVLDELGKLASSIRADIDLEVVTQLAYYEKMRDEATGIQAVAVKVLEDVPETQKDWHPRSDGQVLDLVHPSLYPIVYGRTVGYPEVIEPGKERNVADLQPITPPDLTESSGRDWGFLTESSGRDWGFSNKFAWLSTDFKVSEDGSSAKSVSYINNLHPSHKELYSIIESLVARFSFLFDRVLTDLDCYYQSFNPRIAEGYRFDDDDEDKPEQEEGESDEDYEDRLYTWNLQRPITLPTVPSKDRKKDISERKRTYTIHGKEAQIIVKLANIHLTPEKSVYPGGSWHVEGLANERIIASGIYYYDSENITESELRFRRVVSDEDLEYEQDDELGVMRVWGLKRGGPANQSCWGVPTSAGRCLAFPNIYQHKVSPFKLANQTKPGHRKIVALFLVDPQNPRFSTTDIPPQQAEWYEVAMQQAPENSLLRKLPAEIMREITRHLPNLTTLEEAKQYRLELMDERTAFVEKQDEECFESQFNFCEH